MIYGFSDKVSVRIFDGKCEIDFSLVYPRLHVTGTYNLLNNAAIFVQKESERLSALRLAIIMMSLLLYRETGTSQWMCSDLEEE